METIDLRRLEGFYRVVEHGGYAAAARAFPYPITAAGIHHQVSRLENDLGVQLCERVAKDSIVPTAAGRALHDYASSVLEPLPSVVSAVRAHRYGGVLRVQASRQIIEHLLPAWFGRLRRQRPDITIELGPAGCDPLKALRNHQADLVVEHVGAIGAEFEGHRVGTIVGAIVLPAKHRAARGRFSLDKLRSLPMVAYGLASPEYEEQQRALASVGLEPEIVARVDSAESISSLVAAGLGFSLVPMLGQARAAHPGLKIVTLREAPRYPVYALRRKSAFEEPLVEAAMGEAPKFRPLDA